MPAVSSNILSAPMLFSGGSSSFSSSCTGSAQTPSCCIGYNCWCNELPEMAQKRFNIIEFNKNIQWHYVKLHVDFACFCLLFNLEQSCFYWGTERKNTFLEKVPTLQSESDISVWSMLPVSCLQVWPCGGAENKGQCVMKLFVLNPAVALHLILSSCLFSWRSSLLHEVHDHREYCSMNTS